MENYSEASLQHHQLQQKPAYINKSAMIPISRTVTDWHEYYSIIEMQIPNTTLNKTKETGMVICFNIYYTANMPKTICKYNFSHHTYTNYIQNNWRISIKPFERDPNPNKDYTINYSG